MKDNLKKAEELLNYKLVDFFEKKLDIPDIVNFITIEKYRNIEIY